MIRERIVQALTILVVCLVLPAKGQSPLASLEVSSRFSLVLPFEADYLLLSLPLDSLSRPPALLSRPYKIKRTVYIDELWSYITLGETVDGLSVLMPFIAPLDWYFEKMIIHTRKKQFRKVFNTKTGDQKKQVKSVARGKGIEVVGVDVDRIGRVSINARGNVTLKGKMVFEDQELIRSKINETQNTHLEFDQTQRISLEGKIGDRVSVKVDQDSERDFDWENNIRISYRGEEDDIVQSVDAGNISLSLPGSQSLMGSANHEGLFGIKSVSKFGPVDFTAIASIVSTEKKSQEYKGRTESKTHKIKDSNYIKNKYFYIHEWFRNGVRLSTGAGTIIIPPFYPLDNGLHRFGNVIVRDFELYQLDQTTNSETNAGLAMVDVNQPGKDDQTGLFKRLEQGQDFRLSEDLGFIRVRQMGFDEVLGCTFILMDRTTGDTLMTVGQGISADQDQLILKMIKPRSLTPSHPVWPLMFKNVYSLGATNISKEGFEVRIKNDRLPIPSHLDPQGVPYITRFGLDSLDENGNNNSDQIIDLSNPNIISLIDGELFFPELRPFAGDTVPDGNQNQALKGALGVGFMYTSTQRTDIANDSRFTIEVDYANLNSTINLGFMLVEGSEQVYKGGVLLRKSLDYQVDYFSGTIVLNEPPEGEDNIRVIYDKYQLVTFDKKTILGVRSQMDLGKNSFLGGTALFFNQSVINDKIEVGYEPMRNFIWGLNGRYQNELPGLTNTIDRLPMVSTDKASNYSIEGEFSQILPNPNPLNNKATGDPRGVAYIDDFEGSKRITSTPIQRRYWKESSAPLDKFTGLPFSQRNRARLNWYNPYVQVLTRDIWPNLSTSVQAQNETTDILVLNVKPRDHQINSMSDSVWAGIIHPFYSGDYDQTQAKFFEIWLKGNAGKLTIDLGQISEDWDGNGTLNTEDIPEGGLIGDGILDDREDIGLDGCPDEYEDGWGFCLDPESLTYSQLRAQGEINLINTNNDVNPEDPNGDNWNYSEGSFDYSRINGTEKNALDAGRYPDTEDLDLTGFLDQTNDYFTKTFSLEDSLFLAGETKINGSPTGWRLFRIPLIEFETSSNSGNREWNSIHNLRLVVTNVEESAVIQIAKMEMVGNEWQELGIAPDSSENFVKSDADTVFTISVINTDDNAGYRPPRGVLGEFDRINQIRSKEQSLILKFNELPGGYKGAALKTLLSLGGDRAKSYLSYRKMKMFVYGKSPWINAENTKLQLIMRFGYGENYYEVSQPVYDGWDEDRKRNDVNLDLKWLTRLKLQDSTTVEKFNETDIFLDDGFKKEYWFTDAGGQKTGKRISIVGQPALNRIQYFIVGVKNLAQEAVSGEVWIDELRLSGIEKERGISLRMQGKLNFADLAQTSIVYRRKDADFHTLQQRLGSNNSNESFNINSRIALDKFLPNDWGIRIPLTAAFSNSISRPKYFPGQDVTVGSDPPDSILTLSNKINISVKASKTSKSDNRLIKYTLDKINTSFSASRGKQSNPIQKEILNESYSGAINYALPFSRNNYFMPLKWLDGVPFIGEKLGKTHLYYTPSNLNANINASEKLTRKSPRQGDPSPDIYNFGLGQSYALDYKFTESLNSKYSRKIKSNLNDFRGYAWGAMKNFNPGIVTDITENLSTSFSPVLSDWLKPTFNYSSNFRWNEARDSNVDGANIGSQLRFSGGISISPSKIVELIYNPGKSKSKKIKRARTPFKERSRITEPDIPNKEQDKDTEPKIPEQKDKSPKKEKRKMRKSPFLRKTHKWSQKISPVNISYSENLNRTGLGVQGNVPAGYKFGWLPEHGLAHSEQVGANTGNWDHKRDFSIRSGLNLSRQLSISFNFSQGVSTNRRNSGIEQRTLSRDYFAYGKYLSSGFPFV
ncbi:MAG: cell surface protein SprA, partial [Candidatus Neomarinimicrobiota bacterium]